jgi:hypothetical protein
MIFLYGGMIWGVLPFREQTSWESHAVGAITGIIYGFIFRKITILPQTDDISKQAEIPQYSTSFRENETDNNQSQISTTKLSYKQKVDNWHNYNNIKYDYKSKNYQE